MFGIPIRSYAALDHHGIGPINDAVGGVTVTPHETFGSFTKGKTVKVGKDNEQDNTLKGP